MLDGTVVRAHRHAAGAKGGRTARCWAGLAAASRPKSIPAATRGLPLALVLTPGQTHGTRAFAALVEDLPPGTRCLIRDTGCDAGFVREHLLLRGILPVIPPNPVRTEPASLDRDLDRLRKRVERLVNKLEQFRAVATRDDKTAERFLAFIHLAASRLWLRRVRTA